MNLKLLNIKLILEHIIMQPFVLLGRLYAKLNPLSTKHEVFLIFPNADIGGSIQVNLDLAICLIDKNPLIIFSKKPKNNKFLAKYEGLNLSIIDLHKKIDNKVCHFVNFFYRGVIVEWACQQSVQALIGGECIFFYKIIPHLPKLIKRIEVLHVDSWLNYNIGFINEISLRVFSTKQLKEKVENQYKQNNVPNSFYSKLKFIENGLKIIDYPILPNDTMQVYYIGRGAAQKRVHLVAAIAEKIKERDIEIQFNFVGDVDKIINPALYPYCKFHGSIHDENTMNSIYQKADVLILTSAFEGLPVVVMQMMAHEKVVVSTAVNSIPNYIIHNVNGLLIDAQSEEDIINEGVNHLINLYEHPDLRISFGKRSKEIAMEKFSMEVFCKEYNQLITC